MLKRNTGGNKKHHLWNIFPVRKNNVHSFSERMMEAADTLLKKKKKTVITPTFLSWSVNLYPMSIPHPSITYHHLSTPQGPKSACSCGNVPLKQGPAGFPQLFLPQEDKVMSDGGRKRGKKTGNDVNKAFEEKPKKPEQRGEEEELKLTERWRERQD